MVWTPAHPAPSCPAETPRTRKSKKVARMARMRSGQCPQLHRHDPCYSGRALIDSAFRCAAYSLSPAPEGSAPLHDHKLREPYSGRRCARSRSPSCVASLKPTRPQHNLSSCTPRQPRAFLSPRGAVRWQGSHRRRRTQRLYLHCPHLIRACIRAQFAMLYNVAKPVKIATPGRWS